MLVILSPVTKAMALEVLKVHWAGWSFAGDAAAAPLSYPHSNGIYSQDSGAASIDSRLAEIAVKSLPPGVELVRGELIAKKRGTGLAMTFALDGEYVSVERMSSFHSVSIWLSGQIVVFDFESARLLASFPVGVLLTTVLKEEPTPEFLQAKIRRMLLAEEDADNVNLLNEFGRRLRQFKMRRDYPITVQLRHVRLAEKTIAKMPVQTRSDPRALRAFTQFIGGSFNKSLSGQANLPTLPYIPKSEGDGEGRGKIAGAGQSMTVLLGQVDDATIYNLIVPEPDYVFDLEVAGFSKAVVSESHGAKKWVYASYVDASFREPLRDSVYLQQRLVNPSFEDIPNGAVIDDWAAYRTSLYQLLHRFGGALSAAPPREWIDAQPAGPALVHQLKAAVAKLDLCR